MGNNHNISPSKIREVGSEFHAFASRSGSGLSFSGAIKNECFVFSGRTAIETALKNIACKCSAEKAALPSYCCSSMIQPFTDLGIKVQFYDVWFDDGLCVDVGTLDDVDIVLWCNYFGFSVPMPDFTEFKDAGGIIIEDITHSLFSDSQYHDQSDYLVASLRKWGPIICGGYCAAIRERLQIIPTIKPSSDYLIHKSAAMNLKSKYLDDGDEEKKAVFLSMFNNCNTWLANNYQGVMIDSYSLDYIKHIDCDEQRAIRRDNSRYLLEGLKSFSTVKPLFKESEMDCPIFMPVIIEGGKRDAARQHLIDNKIYCPVHWPYPRGECVSNLYDLELSLICDQRYGEEDMKKIIETIKAFEGK